MDVNAGRLDTSRQSFQGLKLQNRWLKLPLNLAMPGTADLQAVSTNSIMANVYKAVSRRSACQVQTCETHDCAAITTKVTLHEV